MQRNSSQFISNLFLILCALLLFSDSAFTEEKEKYLEIGLGGGTNLEGINSKSMLLAPAINWKIKGTESLRLRLEGNLEFVKDKKHLIIVGGVSPFLRIHASGKTIKPFLEVGVGANVASRDEIGERNLGGIFLFSLMGGAGFEFVAEKHMISISYRFRHLSNAHLYPTNQGVNFQYVMVSISF